MVTKTRKDHINASPFLSPVGGVKEVTPLIFYVNIPENKGRLSGKNMDTWILTGDIGVRTGKVN